MAFLIFSIRAKQISVNGQIQVFINVEDDLHPASSFLKPVPNGLHRDLCRSPVWEHENTCGNTAERHTFQVLLCSQIQAGHVTGSKQALMLLCEPSLHYRPNGMQYIFARQIVTWCNLGLSGWLLMSLRFHYAIAGTS